MRPNMDKKQGMVIDSTSVRWVLVTFVRGIYQDQKVSESETGSNRY
jgi:hypothetical protein